jgi:hypothetical protein
MHSFPMTTNNKLSNGKGLRDLIKIGLSSSENLYQADFNRAIALG